MIKEKALNSAYNLQWRVYRIFSLQSPTGLYILAREQASDGPSCQAETPPRRMDGSGCRTVEPGFGCDRGVRLVGGSSLTERTRMRSSLSFAEKGWVSVKLPIIPGKGQRGNASGENWSLRGKASLPRITLGWI
jgi:hypothetical protein